MDIVAKEKKVLSEHRKRQLSSRLTDETDKRVRFQGFEPEAIRPIQQI